MNSEDEVTGPINLGNPSEFTIAELANRVIDLTGSSSRIIHMALPVNDPVQRRPDISLANSILGWQPTVALNEGLLQTIPYFERLMRANAA
jgi:UDP-glucuronate decarboxylase